MRGRLAFFSMPARSCSREYVPRRLPVGRRDVCVPDRGLARRGRAWAVDLGRFRERGRETGAVACDHYRLWQEDVDLIASLGVNAYRFSIAWPRLIPNGFGSIEQRGFDHYSRLI